MAGYISLVQFTSQGETTVKDLPKRIDAVKKTAAGMGVNTVGVWLTMGQYDLVAIFDAPSDHVMGTLLMALAGKGNGSSETMRAFSEDEIRTLVSKM
ncbi:MAG: GYD domain-containing protein [Anaerolineae bacterium]|nr:GYD domain-containing protein [Anaerolineae bacterium]